MFRQHKYLVRFTQQKYKLHLGKHVKNILLSTFHNAMTFLEQSKAYFFHVVRCINTD